MVEQPTKPQPAWWRRLFGTANNAETLDELAFPPGFMELLERLRVVALKAAGGGLKEGHRLGAYRGGQLEFHDHRAYTPGDDLRYLDWSLYARLGRPFIKEFAREEAGQMHLLLDASPSMQLGTPSKWNSARRIAALFMHVALSARDHVRMYLLHDAELESIPLRYFPKAGQRLDTRAGLNWLSAQKPLLPVTAPHEQFAQSSRALTLHSAIVRFLRLHPPRGRVFLLSDFWYEAQDLTQAIQLLSGAGHELAGLHLLSNEETLSPELGAIRVSSLEEWEELDLHFGASAVAAFRKALEDHLELVESLFQKRAGQYLFAHSDVALEKVLIQTLRQRRWVR